MGWVATVIEGVRKAVTTKRTDGDLKGLILQAILDHESFLGIDVTQQLKYQFRPYSTDDLTLLDPVAFENAVNISINETLKLKVVAELGRVETKAITLDKELAFIRVRCNKKGATDFSTLTLDVSVDKKNEVPDGNMGTWIVSDQVVESFGVGELVDVSGVVAKTFSLKLSLAAESALELTDMLVELYFIPSQSLADHLTKLRDTVCGMLYDTLLQKAIENTNAPDTVRALQQMADVYRKRGLGILATSTGKISSKQGAVADSVASRPHDSSVFQPHLSDVSNRAQGLRRSGDIPIAVHDTDGVKTVILDFDTAGFMRFP